MSSAHQPTVGTDHNVPDSTDWLETPLSGLAQVESALRCQVCKDFFTTPMITACAHTFCSLCIRKCLSADAKCPACRKPQQEVALRYNGALDDVVESFTKTRKAVLEVAQRPITLPVGEKVREPSPKRRLDQDEFESDSELPLRKRTRASRRAAGEPAYTPDLITLDDDDVEDSDDRSYNEQPKDLVDCPMCNALIKMNMINAHIDRHLAEPPILPEWGSDGEGKRPTSSLTNPNNRSMQTSSRASTFSRSSQPTKRKPTPLPALSYSLMKETVLRKKLNELGISTNGNKQMLERRHTEWVNLWNANCDSLRPKSKQQLLHELEVWERTQGSNSSVSVKSITRKDFDTAAWSSNHGQEFQDLIAKARNGLKQKRANQAKQDESEPKEVASLDGVTGQSEPFLSSGPTAVSATQPHEDADIYKSAKPSVADSETSDPWDRAQIFAVGASLDRDSP